MSMLLSSIQGMWRSRRSVALVCVGLIFLMGAVVGSELSKHGNSDMEGIRKLHELDVRVTLANDPKALQQEWADGAVRIEGDNPVDIGKDAIYASDVRDSAKSPGFAIVSFTPDIRDVQVSGDWAFEWGVFDVRFRMTATESPQAAHGKLLRVLHRERGGDWKFARVMVVEDSPAQR